MTSALFTASLVAEADGIEGVENEPIVGVPRVRFSSLWGSLSSNPKPKAVLLSSTLAAR